jgi:LysM repeat protein
MNRISLILFFSFFCIFHSFAQNMTAQEYVQKYKDLAIEEMKRMGVPAAITLAQGLLETENGNSDLLLASNNHFGIKCKSTWTAETVSHDDDALGECFRKYKCAEDSYRDHSNFLRGNPRYDFLFKLDPADYKAWAYGLRKAGYATNPNYPQILIKNIEDNNLEQYTMEAINNVPHFDASQYASDTKDNDETDSENVAQTLDQSASVAPVSFTINGCKALYVSKGTSLLAIATQNNINLQKLLSINDLTNDGILEKGQYIFLEKKQKEGPVNFCIAAADESMYDIAQKYGVILQNLYTYNQLNPGDFIVAGTKIYLKPHVENPPVSSSNTATALQTSNTSNLYVANNNLSHEVLPKESLYGISKKYGVSVEQIKSLNHLTTDNIQVGQKLIISK